jgi:hypothetical protein
MLPPAALLSCGFLASTMTPPARVTQVLRRFIRGIWTRVPDEVEGTIAQWIAKVIFYLLSLLTDIDAGTSSRISGAADRSPRRNSIASSNLR